MITSDWKIRRRERKNEEKEEKEKEGGRGPMKEEGKGDALLLFPNYSSEKKKPL